MSVLTPSNPVTPQNTKFTIENGIVKYNGVAATSLTAYPIIVGNSNIGIDTAKFWYKPGQLFIEAIIVGISFALFNAFIYWSLEKIITRWFGQPKSYKLMRIMILITISSFLSAAALHLLFELFGLNRYYILNYLYEPISPIGARDGLIITQ